MAKKRKYGSGTVRKRSDGRWEARVVVGYDDNGNPKTKNVLAKTKAECLLKLEELKEKYAPPVTKCKPDMPFGDWMDFWYQNYCKPQLRLNTQLGYEDRIYKHIIPEIGKIPLNQLTHYAPLLHSHLSLPCLLLLPLSFLRSLWILVRLYRILKFYKVR